MSYPKPNTPSLTYADHLVGPEGPCDELIDGVLFVREPPTPTCLHQDMVGGLYHQIRLALAGKPGHVFIAPLDVLLPKSDEPDEEIDTVVEPDVFIVCDLHKLRKRAIRGAPDWVAEVLSPSTAKRDLTVKRSVYERAGVKETWFIHPTKRTLTLYKLEDGHYAEATVLELKGQTTLSAVPDVTIDWDRLLAEIG